MAVSPSVVFLVPCKERTGEFSNYPFGLFQSLLGLLPKSYSDSTPFQEALGVLRVINNNKKTHEKMLTITVHKGNANKNHTKIPPHPC
jgi:hypothetical protein